MALAMLGHKSVHAELVIPASPERVWAVLTDAAGYGEWNPVFIDVQGEYREGAKLTYQMRDQSGKTTKVESEVVRFLPDRELNQRGGVWGLLTFDHKWLLEPVDGGTRVIQHEEYRGLGVWFWDPSWFESAYERALVALKERVAPLTEPSPGPAQEGDAPGGE